MNLVGNIIWIILGGFTSFLSYITGGLALCLTIVGIPFGIQCFKLGIAILLPFGKHINTKETSSGCLSLFLNVIWIIFGGIFATLNHLIFGVLLCITIIGIPFGMQHFKLMKLSFMPFGKSFE